MSYPKYPWIGNRIAEADMASLYRLKQQTKKPITILVAEAISRYLSTVTTGLSPDYRKNEANSDK